MFIHWSPGGIYGAHWNGEPFGGPGAYGEWTRCRNRVPRADYDAALPLFQATPEAIEQWVALAKEAGMKYIVFVAKHHDGLAFWPSKVSDYNLPRLNEVDFPEAGDYQVSVTPAGEPKAGLFRLAWVFVR